MTLLDIQYLAPGHNNVAGLLPFYSLSGTLFSLYNSYPLQTEWHDGAGKALDGSAVTFKTWGKLWFDIIFAVLTEDERLYLDANFGTEVTVRGRNKRLKTWANYNASLIQPPDLSDTFWITWVAGHWEQARYRFKLLTVIP